MPQIFQVLRCYKCLVFQVHQTKKSNKWECKLCGEKQSIKRHYGIGTGTECRMHVQKLNGLRGEIEESDHARTCSDDEIENNQPVKAKISSLTQKESKWSNYIEKDSEKADDNGSMYHNNSEVVLELPQKRKRVFGKKKHQVTNTCMEKTVESLHSIESEETLLPIKKEKIELKTHQECLHPFALKEEINTNIDNKHNTINKFKPPIINTNSRWAQYADEECYEDPSEDLENLDTDCLKQSHYKTAFFSQCNDSDIDNILDL